ncbi:hypothetical protein ACHHYP_13625 [Achlya hypogyna]|uniref:Transmembrane protein n=1 Tax=Achlya hypogyna TaxID=1202772 RepID=A0A1V9ZFI2_ACHHY|nr:hypothetical protein ACHHYP_13625 [Achlya hypogyna]
MQVQGEYAYRIEDTVLMYTALGWSYSLTIKPMIPWRHQSMTSKSGDLRSDAAACVSLRCSLVPALGLPTLESLGLATVVADTTLVLPPPSLVAYFTSFQLALTQILNAADADIIDAYSSFATLLGDTNPTLLCTSSVCPFSELPDVASVVFAMVVTGSNATSRIATLCDATTACTHLLQPLALVLTAIRTVRGTDNDRNRAVAEVAALEVTAPSALVQTFHRIESLGGWIALHEWLSGQREMHLIEATVTRTVLTPRLPLTTASATAHEIPSNWGTIMSAVGCYTTSILAVVAVAVGGQALQFRPACVPCINFFHFNRLVGAAWLSRALLGLRSLGALVFLSTTKATLEVDVIGRTRLITSHVSLGTAMVASGEITWLVYLVQDLLAPVSRLHRAAPVGSALAWSMLTFVSYSFPVDIEYYPDRVCTYEVRSDVAAAAVCTSGVVTVGTMQRLLLLASITVTSVFVAFLALQVSDYYFYWWWWFQPIDPHAPPKSLLFSSTTLGLLVELRSRRTALASTIDVLSSTLAGFVPGRHFVFDINLWTYTPNVTNIAQRSVGLRVPTFAWPLRMRPGPRVSLLLPRKVPNGICRRHFRAIAGLGYLVASVFGSFAYISATASSMANAFWWCGFNSSAHQPYLANWFNTQLQLRSDAASIALDADGFADDRMAYNTTGASAVLASTLYPAVLLQDAASDVASVIAALRTMDVALVPLIFTPYCFVDLNRTWEMANSAARQARCYTTPMVGNGAVYLEALVANVDWSELAGTSFWSGIESGVVRYLNTSRQGQAWVLRASATAVTTTVNAEVMRWHRSGVTSYTTQWQNYKLLGVVEAYGITNAFNRRYPMTLKTYNFSVQIESQSSYHLYWGLANDLLAVSANSSTPIAGKSLVRQSADFAFANQSLQVTLVAESVLASPLDAGSALVRSALGPFGSVDMVRVQPPRSLVKFYSSVTQTVLQLLTTDASAAAAFAEIPAVTNVVAVPLEWQRRNTSGMDVLYGGCAATSKERVRFGNQDKLKAVLAMGTATVAPLVAAICSQDILTSSVCSAMLTRTVAFLDAVIVNATQSQLQQLAQLAQREVEALEIVVVGYLDGPELGRHGLFATTPFSFFSWVMLLHWIEGTREVVSFTGDLGSITTISSHVNLASTPPNQMEIPRDIMEYVAFTLKFISVVLLVVAIFIALYMFRVSAQVEGFNMFWFNRVVGAVWIGYLSTAAVDVIAIGAYYSLVLVPDRTMSVLLAAGEVTWAVYVVNDVATTLARLRSPAMAVSSSVLSALGIAIWSLVAPVQPAVTLHRRCTVVAVDALFDCDSGTVVIGSHERLLGLTSLVVAVSGASAGLARRSLTIATPLAQMTSLFLPASAAYLFHNGDWTYHDVYCIDRASACLAGVITVEVRDSIYCFDIKTWRGYKVPMAESSVSGPSPPVHIAAAVPLLE